MGCDNIGFLYRMNKTSFNPRTHMGCDFITEIRTLNKRLFQSTHPHGVRQTYGYLPRFAELFQSTHPHGVRRKSAVARLSCLVSIHAPTWGATALAQGFSPNLDEFQSTHPHGVRLFISNSVFIILLFQSTHPHGVRPMISFDSNYISVVSIHAPTWGATRSECDKSVSMVFQSTHPHGVRLFVVP